MDKEMIIKDVAERLQRQAHTIYRAPHEDTEDIVNDGIVFACNMLASAQAKGKTPTASNLAHYALCNLASARRSNGSHRTDALAVDRLRNRLPIDAETSTGESWHEVLACKRESPAMVALRNLDWQGLLDCLTPTQARVFVALIQGEAQAAIQRCQHISERAMRRLRQEIMEAIERAMPDWREYV